MSAADSNDGDQRGIRLSDFQDDVKRLLKQFLTTPAKSRHGGFETDPVQDRLYHALVDSFTSSSMTLIVGEDVDYYDEDDEEHDYGVAFPHDDDKFPYLSRFLSKPPECLTDLHLRFNHPVVFLSVPSTIGDENAKLKTISISNHWAVDRANGFHDSLGNLLYSTRFIKNVDLNHIHPLLRATRNSFPAFESKTESLTLAHSRFGSGSSTTGVLNEKTTFSTLKKLDFSSLYLGSRANPFEFWKQFLSKSIFSLKEISFNRFSDEDLDAYYEVYEDPSVRLFPTLCMALSRPGSTPSGLTKLSLEVDVNSLFHLEILARSPIAWTLKHLEIIDCCSMEPCLSSTIASFPNLSSLKLSMVTRQSQEAAAKATDFFVDYAKQQSSSFSSLDELIILNVPLEYSRFQETRWTSVQKLEIRHTGLCGAESKFAVSESFPALKHLKISEKDGVNSRSVKEALLQCSLLTKVKVEELSISAPNKLSSYTPLSRAVASKKCLFDFNVAFKKGDTKKPALSHQKHFQEQCKMYTFLHRLDESLKSSTPDIPLGFYPHILEKCGSHAGPSGLYLALKDKLLSDIGLAQSNEP